MADVAAAAETWRCKRWVEVSGLRLNDELTREARNTCIEQLDGGRPNYFRPLSTRYAYSVTGRLALPVQGWQSIDGKRVLTQT